MEKGIKEYFSSFLSNFFLSFFLFSFGTYLRIFGKEKKYENEVGESERRWNNKKLSLEINFFM